MELSRIRSYSAIFFPLVYVISSFIFKSPDVLTLNLGIFGVPIWIVQWFASFIGGPIAAYVAALLLLSITGLIVGWLLEILLAAWKRMSQKEELDKMIP
jgi:hypothetical protein